MVIEYFNREFQNYNLALLAQSGPEGDVQAARAFAKTMTQFTAANHEAFSAPKPFAYRNGLMEKAIAKLSSTDNLGEAQTQYLTVMQTALTVQADILLQGHAAVVKPDYQHWDVELQYPDVPSSADNDFVLKIKEDDKRAAIEAYPELAYAGFLFNPADPTKEEFPAEFVHNPERMAQQTEIIAHETGLDKERLLLATFASAANKIGQRIMLGTPAGQFGEDYFLKVARTANTAWAASAPTP